MNKKSKEWNDELDSKLIKFNETAINKQSFMLEFKMDWPKIMKRLQHLNILPERLKVTHERKYLKNEDKFRCIDCKQIFSSNQEFKHPTRNTNRCFECYDLHSKNTRKKVKETQTIRQYIAKKIWQSRKTCIRKKLKHEIDEEIILNMYSIQKGLCFYSKIPMSYSVGDRFALSIDRLDSQKGYELKNVVLCCEVVNRMKLDYSVDNFKQMILRLNANKENF
jgi:hypothetical protein